MTPTYPTSTASSTALRGMSAQEVIDYRQQTSIPRPILTFPAGLGVHSTLMRFFEYSYGGTSGSTANNIANIVLPLPKTIQDSFKINVAGDELGILGKGAAQAASSSVGDMLKAVTGLYNGVTTAAENFGAALAGGAVDSALGMGADAGAFLLRAGLGSLTPDITNGISAGRGTAINPFATLVFKGVDLKVHSLEWTLSPESEEESRTLNDIIHTLQSMVLPKVESPLGANHTSVTAIDRGIMRYPAMVDIYFQGIDMNYYFKFKTSMISELTVDYTPNGIAINRGGRPSAIRIAMTLNEAYIHTSDDYKNMDTSIEARAEVVAPEAGPGIITSILDALGVGSDARDIVDGLNDPVPAPDGKSAAQPPTDAPLTDEYRISTAPNRRGQGARTVIRTRAELNKAGITDAQISADSTKYAPTGN
jgi:hypothetical protein